LIAGNHNSYQIEKRFLCKDGGFYWAQLTISSVLGVDGKIQFFVSMTEDITEQKQAQEHLTESEARFRAMFDNVSVGMAMMSLDRRVIAVNQAIERISGYSADELININISDLAFPDDRKMDQEKYLDLISGKRDSLQTEKRYVRKNGEIFWGRLTYSIVRSTHSQPQYLVGSHEDITEQKLATDILSTKESEFTPLIW
jgi:PAS domain S-box-containing protein